MPGFQKVYDTLNTQQRSAVDTIDGPVLVVAGPGTGKTQLLSARVANILRLTDTDPSSILCLTFTNKATANMRDRLLRLTDNTARGVVIRTFHSFAADIMAQYPDYFWNGARLRVAPDAAQLEIIESILGDLPLANPLSLKFAGQFTAIKPVKTALKLVKEAGLTPEKLRAIIELNLAYIDTIEPQLAEALTPTLSAKRLPELQTAIEALPAQGVSDQLSPLTPLDSIIAESLTTAIEADAPTGRLANTGAWKRRWIQTVDGRKGMFDERRRNQWWLALADVYEQYRVALHSRSYYDYDDMVVEVITQLENEAELRASVQERFLYVLIDEFQDTTAAQLRFSQLVADHHAADGKPNIMAVGDDDQAIYAFNGANLGNMRTFLRLYPATKLIVLTENYRSTAEVLAVAARTIDLADNRLVHSQPNLVKQLHAVRTAETDTIEHLTYKTRAHELHDVAKKIAQERHTYPERTIAVLARHHDSLRRLSGLLSTLNVPVAYEQSNDIFTQPAVRQVIVLAQLVVAIQTGDEGRVNELIAQMLRHPMWEIEPELLWRLAAENFTHPRWLDNLIAHHDQRLQSIGHWLLWLAAEADSAPTDLMIDYLLGLRPGEHRTSPWRMYYLQGRPTNEYIAALSATKLLLALVHDFSQRPEHVSLSDFIEYVRVMLDNGQVVTDETPFIGGENAVGLYTVHKAKGLEFDSVYIVDLVEKNWQPAVGGRKSPANVRLQPHGDEPDDYVRLLYVALTRARTAIHASSYNTDEQGNITLPAPIISLSVPPVPAPETAVDPVAVLESTLTWPRLPALSERELLQPRLEHYSLSATHLLHFLDITRGGPAHFLETALLRLPQILSDNIAFGSAIHAALEQAQRQTNAGGEPDIARMMNAYEQALRSERMPRGAFERYLVHGQNVLHRLFEQMHYQLKPGGQPESILSSLLPESGARLNGKLDRVDIHEDGSLVIVDYKTGTPLAGFATRDHTKVLKAWRHRTQLLFYLLLAQESGRFKNNPHMFGQLVYVESESPRQLILTFDPDDTELARVRALVHTVWQHIIALDFPDITAYSTDLPGIQHFEQDLIDGRI